MIGNNPTKYDLIYLLYQWSRTTDNKLTKSQTGDDDCLLLSISLVNLFAVGKSQFNMREERRLIVPLVQQMMAKICFP